MGEAVDHSFSKLAPEDVHAVVAYLRSVPGIVSPDLPATPAPPAPASHRQGGGTPDPRGEMVFDGAFLTCDRWHGETSNSPFATLTRPPPLNISTPPNPPPITTPATHQPPPPTAI